MSIYIRSIKSLKLNRYPHNTKSTKHDEMVMIVQKKCQNNRNRIKFSLKLKVHAMNI